jgi:hypothetical protein
VHKGNLNARYDSSDLTIEFSVTFLIIIIIFIIISFLSKLVDPIGFAEIIVIIIIILFYILKEAHQPGTPFGFPH